MKKKKTTTKKTPKCPSSISSFLFSLINDSMNANLLKFFIVSEPNFLHCVSAADPMSYKYPLLGPNMIKIRIYLFITIRKLRAITS